MKTQDDGMETAAPHAEMFYGSKTAEPIAIGCDCSIGRTHTYAEWVEQFQCPDADGEAPTDGFVITP